MTIEEIKSDEVVMMTKEWHRAFLASDCMPCCHNCASWINIGDNFKLAIANVPFTDFSDTKQGSANSGIDRFYNIVTHDVMLCDKCTAEMLNKQTEKNRKLYEERRNNQSAGCFRINGKIIH